jgi:hypothetical protein
MRPINQYAFIFLLAIPASVAFGQLQQLYIDGCVNFDHFTNLEGFQIDGPQVTGGGRFGFGFKANDQGTLVYKAEFGISRRSLVRSFPSESFRYSFNGIDVAVMVEYQPVERFSFDAGFGFATFYRTFRTERNPKQSNLGEGFQNYDVFVQGGFAARIYKGLFFGSRIRYGLIPLLHYTPIGQYGGFEDEVKIVNTLTHELFLRFKFIDQ